MSALRRLTRSHLARLAALAIVVSAYGFARPPRLADAERRALAARFAFASAPLPLPGPEAERRVRPVNPSYARISAWISAVGAAVALADLDGDGLADDLCWVDVASDRVIVAPVPGTGDRYPPFALAPDGVGGGGRATALPYDRETTAPMGCVPGDLDEDGTADLLVYYWGRTPVAFLRRDGRPGIRTALAASRYVPREISSSGERWYTNALTRADVDGDGHADIILGNYFPDGSRVLDARATDRETMQQSMSRAFNAGRDRVLLWTGARPAALPGGAPEVSYREVDVLPDRVAHGWTLAVGAADLDGDLLPEIYFANDFGPDRLLHNLSTPGHPRFALLEGRRSFFAPRSKTLGRDSFKGMGVDFADLNGDGRLDIYVSDIASEWSLEESHLVWMSTGNTAAMADGRAPYVDRSEPLGLARSGWAWEARFGDFDDDGVPEALQATGFVRGRIDRWPELHELAMGNDEMLRHTGSWPRLQPGDDLSGHQPNPFFVRARSGRYFDLAPDVGLDRPQVSRGIAVADVDGDGDLDFAVANQWESSVFYRNEGPHPGSFLGLHLLLPIRPMPFSGRAGPPGPDTPGFPAIGAQAVVRLPDGRHWIAQVDGGNGHSGVRAAELHFGLGELAPEWRSARNGRPVEVELSWRDRDGALRRRTIHLAPGWHTLVLGGPPSPAPRGELVAEVAR